MATTVENCYIPMEKLISSLPPQCKTHCTCHNKDVTRNIQKLSEKEQQDLKTKIAAELVSFEELYKKHKDIDYQCCQIIDAQLAVIRADPKMKDIYKILVARYNNAKTDTCIVFLGTADRGLNVSSVAGTKLLNFIITYHRHHCQFTNLFKAYCSDTTKEVKRLDMIFANRTVASSPTSIDSEDPLTTLKNKIASIDLDIDEEW